MVTDVDAENADLSERRSLELRQVEAFRRWADLAKVELLVAVLVGTSMIAVTLGMSEAASVAVVLADCTLLLAACVSPAQKPPAHFSILI